MALYPPDKLRAYGHGFHRRGGPESLHGGGRVVQEGRLISLQVRCYVHVSVDTHNLYSTVYSSRARGLCYCYCEKEKDYNQIRSGDWN